MAFDLSHAIVAIAALCVGLIIGFKRWRRPKARSDVPKLPITRRKTEVAPEASEVSILSRIFGSIFITGWLIGWSVGIFVASSIFLSVVTSELETFSILVGLFLGGWLIAAIAGWIAAVDFLIQTIRGRSPRLLPKKS